MPPSRSTAQTPPGQHWPQPASAPARHSSLANLLAGQRPFALCLQRALVGLDGGNLTAQVLLLGAGCALGQFHQFLELDALFRLLGAYFLGPLLQPGFVLLKSDPDNVITTDNLTAELGLACACLALLC